MDGLVIEAWHLAVAGAAGVGAILAPLIKIRAVLHKIVAERADEAVRRDRVESRLARLESFRDSHVQACTAEHSEIREQIRLTGDALASRLDAMGETSARERALMQDRIAAVAAATGKIEGGLDVLLAAHAAKGAA